MLDALKRAGVLVATPELKGAGVSFVRVQSKSRSKK